MQERGRERVVRHELSPRAGGGLTEVDPRFRGDDSGVGRSARDVSGPGRDAFRFAYHHECQLVGGHQCAGDPVHVGKRDRLDPALRWLT
jgi:hypothetical protein